MELKQFIHETLVQIAQGVHEAQRGVASTGARISPATDANSAAVRERFVYVPRVGFVEKVTFDVAVTTTESESSSGGAGILVASIGLGVRGESGAASEAVSRISFSIPVLLPSGNDIASNE